MAKLLKYLSKYMPAIFFKVVENGWFFKIRNSIPWYPKSVLFVDVVKFNVIHVLGGEDSQNT